MLPRIKTGIRRGSAKSPQGYWPEIVTAGILGAAG